MTSLPVLPDELLRRYDVQGPRYTSYPTAPEWTPEVTHEIYARALVEAGHSPMAPLSLYVHLPFCRSMCTYCGCNVVITKDRKKVDRYIELLGKEIAMAAKRLGRRQTLSQVHFGGGTPTYLDPEQLTVLWEAIRSHFTPLPNAEISVEIDPRVTTHAHLDALRGFGFNRVSMGVQDFDPEVQAAAGRVQSKEQTQDLIDHARSLGIDSVNLDLIYGLPHQTPERWARTLDQVIAIRPDRLAIYSFAFVPDVRPHQRRLPSEAIPTGGAKLALFRLAHEAFTGAGYRQIGMDHFALPDDELSRALDERVLWRNFQGYTVKSADDVVAFGVTSISDIAGVYAQNVKPIPHYAESVDKGRFPTERGIVLSEDDRRRRTIITQIMCNFWLDLGPHGGARAFARELDRLSAFEKDGLLRISGDEIEVTPLGRILIRNIAMVFDTFLERPEAHRAFSRTV